MTCIIAAQNQSKGNVILASDSQVTTGTTITAHDAQKLIKYQNGLIIGAAGAMSNQTALKHALQCGTGVIKNLELFIYKQILPLLQETRDQNDEEHLDMELIIAYKDELFTLESDQTIMPHYCVAVGSGSKVGYGAFLALKEEKAFDDNMLAQMKKALYIVSMVDVYCDDNIIWAETLRKRK
jgi:ATP-dependent protease HslVU (ClpYQ) peptidase subunit